METKIIGQNKLLAKLKSYTLATLPKTILFIGQDGCGKHLFSKYISELYNLNYIKIDDINIDSEKLFEYNSTPINTLYLIDLNLFTDKQQNKLLKFIEEPSKNIYIILISTTEQLILPTILNRCIKYTFEEYTVEQLKEIKYFTNSLIYTICNTPGQLLTYSDIDLELLIQFCSRFLQSFSGTTTELLKYSINFNYKDNYDKIEILPFIKMIKYISFNKYIESNNNLYLNIYLFTNKYCKKLLYKNINKESFIINYFLTLKEFLLNGIKVS